MAESNRTQSREEDEQRRQSAELSPAPVYDDGARREQSALYEQIAARGPFRYDADADPLYRMARDRFVQSGRMAMKDSMGQAAALTGGYDSSYGQAVGQQQYDASLRGLTELIPELYDQAYRMYKDQGDELQRQYDLLGKKADRDYDRYRDELGDWRSERAWQQEREDSAYDRAADAYARLYALISATGYEPGDEELAAAGMSREAAEALIREYRRSTGQPLNGKNAAAAPVSDSRKSKLGLDAVIQQAREARQSNQQRDLYRSCLKAIEEGKADFSRKDLNELWNRHHWFN